MSRHVGSSRFPHPRRRSGARPAESRSSRAVGRDAFRALRPASPQIQRHAAAHSGGAVRGGRWTDGDAGEADGASAADENDPRAEPVSWSRRVRGQASVQIAGRDVEVTPGQALRFEVARGQAEAAVRAVREIDPRWRGRGVGRAERSRGRFSTRKRDCARRRCVCASSETPSFAVNNSANA